jgi:uncharacterized protein (DUF2235 family)
MGKLKHLIFLFDGTWVSASEKNYEKNYSNIFHINSALDHHDLTEHDQICFYYPGIGSRAFGNKLFGGAFGKGYERAIESAYISLCSNFRRGDKLYLFGFSRGGAVARALAGFISTNGIMKANYLRYYNLAWKKFVGYPLTSKEQKLLNSSLELSPEECLGIVKFIGLFDPVFAGFSPFVQEKFTDISIEDSVLFKSIEKAIVLISVDETRYYFSPMLWTSKRDYQELYQIWCPGTHSDVGGTNFESYFAELSLLTMLREVRKSIKLKIHPDFFVKLQSNVLKKMNGLNKNISISDEITGIWKIIGYFRNEPRIIDSKNYKFYHDFMLELKGNHIDIKYKKLNDSFDSRYENYLSYNGSQWYNF